MSIRNEGQGHVWVEVHGDVCRGNVVLATSRDSDVGSLGSLQNESYERVNIDIHCLAPSLRVVQNLKQPSCCKGVSNPKRDSEGGYREIVVHFARPGRMGTS